MSYVEKHLLPGEQITYRTTRHWNVYRGPVLVTALLFAPLFVAAVVAGKNALAALPLLFSVVAFSASYTKRRFCEYAVTNKRIIAKVGVFQTRSVELLLTKVEALTVTQGLAGKLFGYGDIVITGSGGTREHFADVHSPLSFRRAVQLAADARSVI